VEGLYNIIIDKKVYNLISCVTHTQVQTKINISHRDTPCALCCILDIKSSLPHPRRESYTFIYIPPSRRANKHTRNPLAVSVYFFFLSHVDLMYLKVNMCTTRYHHQSSACYYYFNSACRFLNCPNWIPRCFYINKCALPVNVCVRFFV